MQKLIVTLIAISISVSFILIAAFLNFHIEYSVQAQNSIDTQKTFQLHIPTTISKEAQELMRLFNMDPFDYELPDPNDPDELKKFSGEIESLGLKVSQSTRDLFSPNITETRLGGLNVLDIKPKNWKDNGKVLVYTHGGGNWLLSAQSTLSNSVLAANSTGLRVISLDYPLAPFSKWDQTTDEVMNAIRALLSQEGYSHEDIAIYGDSAGGGLAVASVLKMRDNGIGMPAAVVLWSPRVDLSQRGDTYFTLSHADIYLKGKPAPNRTAHPYASVKDLKNPYVSPVYGNFSKGFPPTLIQGGTKEFLLSDFVRLYQALDQAKVEVKLDVYEGMPHVFQSLFSNTTESDIALSKMNDFLRLHLDY